MTMFRSTTNLVINMGFIFCWALVSSLLTTVAMAEPQPGNFQDEIEMARKMVSKDRHDLVLKNMGLSVHDEKKFFGVYNAYRDEMKPLLDKETQLLLDYADSYKSKNLSDEQALGFANTLLDVKSQKIALRKKYIAEFAEKVSPKYVARFIQVENKLDAIMGYDMARQVPLVPVGK